MKLTNRKGDKVGIVYTCELMDHPSETWRNTSIANYYYYYKKKCAAHTLEKYADLDNDYLINFLLFLIMYMHSLHACACGFP